MLISDNYARIMTIKKVKKRITTNPQPFVNTGFYRICRNYTIRANTNNPNVSEYDIKVIGEAFGFVLWLSVGE